MKKIFVTMMGLTLGVGSMFAQDAGSSKWIGTVGVAPVIIDGTGLQLGFEKAVNNKLSVGLGLNNLVRKESTFTYPIGTQGWEQGILSITSKSNPTTIGLNARYYLIGNNEDAKFGLYGGLGLGFSSHIYQSSSKNLVPETDTLFYSYDYENKERGISASLTGGLDYLLGKGKLFLEIQSVSMLSSSETLVYSNAKGTMASQNGTSTYKNESPSLFWDGYITIGYRLRF
jgi:hypothetical protein